LFEQLQVQLASHATKAGCTTAIGASFGADPQTLSFWLKQGLQPVHYGYKANPRSGLRSACLISSNQAQVVQVINKASRLLHVNTQAQVLQESTPDPVRMQLLHATSSVDSKVLTEDDAKQLVHDYYLIRRNFIDSAGLLLSDEMHYKDSTVRNSVRELLATYANMPPKTRREAETRLRKALLESGLIGV